MQDIILFYLSGYIIAMVLMYFGNILSKFDEDLFANLKWALKASLLSYLAVVIILLAFTISFFNNFSKIAPAIINNYVLPIKLKKIIVLLQNLFEKAVIKFERKG